MNELKTEESPLDALHRLTQDWCVISYFTHYYDDHKKWVLYITLNGHLVTEEYDRELLEVIDKLQYDVHITEEFNWDK